MAFSDYLRGKSTNHNYGGTAFTQPTSWEVALFSAPGPNGDGTGPELAGGGYARVSLGTPTIGASPTFIVSNTADLEWPVSTDDWLEITDIAIFDGSGNMLDFGALITPRIVLVDGIFKILAGDLQIQYQ